jgi:hypothetical protein
MPCRVPTRERLAANSWRASRGRWCSFNMPRALFLRPWFFLFDNSLAEEGQWYRTRLLRSVGVFAICAVLTALIFFGALAYCGNYAGDCLVAHY